MKHRGKQHLSVIVIRLRRGSSEQVGICFLKRVDYLAYAVIQ